MHSIIRKSVAGILGVILLVSLAGIVRGSFGSGDRAMLNDINVLTLYHGRMTSARRSSPIPQLKCVGGTAGCDAFTPQVVQCYNRGSDGYDVQWECKTDMDNAYRFGKVEVSCEGFDYPDDPYILKGSCGLEYTIDLTQEGYEKKQSGHSYYGNEQNSYSTYSPSAKGKGSVFGDLLTLGVIAVVIYVIYVTCLSGNNRQDTTNTRRPDPQRPSAPPPPGFRDDYMPGGDGCSSSSSSYDNYSSFGADHTGTRHRTQNAGTGGGFWSGAATGGLLGYLFGSRNNTGYHQQPYGRQGWGSSWGGWGNRGFGGNSWGTGGGWGSSRGSSWGSSGRSSSSGGGGGSSGTRSASGFGGTKRR